MLKLTIRYSTWEQYVQHTRVDKADHQSNNFQAVNFEQMTFPNYFRIDYIRVYQNDEGSIGCDPAGESPWACLLTLLTLDHPTADYIEKYANAYNNPNLTTWEAAGKLY